MNWVLKIREAAARWKAAVQAMQAGVDYKRGIEKLEGSPCSPSSLRVGINTAMVEHSALTELLISKGVITELELWEYMILAMDDEVARYEADIEAATGIKIKLAGTKVTLL